jgi:arginyl-tRNA synthetase
MVILGMWHAAMARHRGEEPKYLDRALADLRAAVAAGEPAKLAHLRLITDRSEEEHKADQDETGKYGLKVFKPFLEECRRRPLLGLTDIETGYLYINALHKAAAETEFAARLGISKAITAMMQRGDEQEHLARDIAIDITLAECNEVYGHLGVLLTNSDIRGESFYNPLLAPVVAELRAALPSGETESGPDGVKGGPAPASPQSTLRAACREDQGALCIFLEKPDGAPAFKGPQGDPLPMIVQKSDGAFLYSSTDLAAAAFRINDVPQRRIAFVLSGMPEALKQITDVLPRDPAERHGGLGATRILYVVGSPQKLHFEMLFAVIQALRWTRPGDGSREVRLEHVTFGSVLGEDRKMLRTRSGENVKLRDLLDEAVQRAEALVRASEADSEKRRDFTEEEIKQISRAVGIGAVKYADLCQNRNTDYIFSWDKMLALAGNTAPYMLYAYARIRSIYRKGLEAGSVSKDVSTAKIELDHPAERALALRILQLPETIAAVGENLLPSMLCDYLYDLAGRFMSFYESCPVLKAESASGMASRLRLCDLTARALRIGLRLLGITTVDRM